MGCLQASTSAKARQHEELISQLPSNSTQQPQQQQVAEPEMTAQHNDNEAAMQQLHTIEAMTNDVALKLRERLPAQRAHLAAAVAAWKWVLHMRVQQQEQAQEYEALYNTIVKKMRMELGAFDYQTREQAELLTRYLCDLDNILSHGDAEVKAARKAMVVMIQQLLQEADDAKVQSSKLKAWGERVIERFHKPVAQIAQTETAVEKENTAEVVSDEDTEDADEEVMDEQEGDNSDADRDQSINEGDEEYFEVEDDDVGEEDDGANDGNDNRAEVEQQQPSSSPSTVPTLPMESEIAQPSNAYRIDIQSLPVWRPYFQIQKRHDGVYLTANLRGINKQHVHVECEPSTGVLRISGFKLPTQKDIMMSRWSGTPTFGRFEIAERFPARMLDMAEATQLLRADGTLEIRLPFYMVQRPRFYRQPTVSFFAPQRCAVW